MAILVCVGHYAENPLRIESLEAQVYCVEELCYVIKENAFLLDDSLMSQEVILWIRNECRLVDLAKSLSSLVAGQGSLRQYVVTILEYTGFYDTDIVTAIAEVLRKGEGRNRYERAILRANSLAQKKRYVTALALYDEIQREWQQEMAITNTGESNLASPFLQNLLHNQGVAYAMLMRYPEAAQSFLDAYEAGGSTECLFSYLAAIRLDKQEEDYIAFIAEHPEYYTISLSVERRMEQLRHDWQGSTQYRAETLRMEERNTAVWDSIVRELKERYRAESV
ncbi:MAG: hypothetical protein LBM69_09620 [Lachnospiraceae bacterium]|jgi:tetratricopeptide (TPR) repeat protein|nr:hypothetical protein [Lachnospiraceae bacterium]